MYHYMCTIHYARKTVKDKNTKIACKHKHKIKVSEHVTEGKAGEARLRESFMSFFRRCCTNISLKKATFKRKVTIKANLLALSGA